ncbi:MAG: MBOAT family protein [Pirellulales bacterium]
MNARWLAWSSLPVGLGAAVWLTADASPLVRMLAVVLATFVAMKLVVLAVARRDGVRVPAANVGWFVAWFGMQPRQFVRRRSGRGPERRWLRVGLANVLLGGAVMVAAIGFGGRARPLLLLVGCSMAFHFGVLTLLAAWFRARAFAVPLLFDAPWRAATAAEFWGRRWNRGFTEMTALVVQRPLAPRLGGRGALLASFVWSGLLHDVALSLPVRAGFGLPTLYFVLQGLFVRWQGERRSRVATLAAVVVPAPLLFHPWFLAGVLGA